MKYRYNQRELQEIALYTLLQELKEGHKETEKLENKAISLLENPKRTNEKDITHVLETPEFNIVISITKNNNVSETKNLLDLCNILLNIIGNKVNELTKFKVLQPKNVRINEQMLVSLSDLILLNTMKKELERGF